MSTDKMKIIVDVDGTKKGSAEFDRMRVKTEGVERAVGQLRNKLLLFTFATAAATAVVVKLTQASIEQEKIFNSLENSINLTGESYNNLKVSLDGYFASLQQSTIYGDTDTAQVLQKLIILTGDYDTALQGVPLSLDLAASGLFDVDTAARMVGMALTGNIEMLGRYIPEFKAATNETLKNMDATEKAAYAIEVLGEKFGGLAEKELNTTAGKWQQFENYWGDVKEAIGDAFLELVRFKHIDFDPDNKGIMKKIEFTKDYSKLTKNERDAEQLRLIEKQKEEQAYYNELKGLASGNFEFNMRHNEDLKKLKGFAYKAEKKRLQETYLLDAELSKQRQERYKSMVGWAVEADAGIVRSTQKAESERLEKIKGTIDEINQYLLDNPISLLIPIEQDKAVPFEAEMEELEAWGKAVEEQSDKEIAGINAKKDAEKARLKAKMDMEKTAFKQAQRYEGDATAAMKDVVKNELSEATAGLVSSILKTVPFPLNTILAAGAGAIAGQLFSGLGLHDGGDFIVPPGYPNDSFPIRVESGERVQVTPANQMQNNNNNETNDLLRALVNKPVAKTTVFDPAIISELNRMGLLLEESS